MPKWARPRRAARRSAPALRSAFCVPFERLSTASARQLVDEVVGLGDASARRPSGVRSTRLGFVVGSSVVGGRTAYSGSSVSERHRLGLVVLLFPSGRHRHVRGPPPAPRRRAPRPGWPPCPRPRRLRPAARARRRTRRGALHPPVVAVRLSLVGADHARDRSAREQQRPAEHEEHQEDVRAEVLDERARDPVEGLSHQRRRARGGTRLGEAVARRVVRPESERSGGHAEHQGDEQAGGTRVERAHRRQHGLEEQDRAEPEQRERRQVATPPKRKMRPSASASPTLPPSQPR